ncbi:type IV pilus modification PilV family protein [Candidatus Ruminimicrobium bovinum]|uniref:type IV pilus modification PilV family protein n=1 Tax=Candidatus Ruminimicrobium bovinum TaxID=3242779 RepID=UPI0039B8C198
MKNKKGFTLIEVVVAWVIMTIIILNISAFFLFAWKLKVKFEEDRAVLGILTSYIEAKKASVVGTAIDRDGDSQNNVFDFGKQGEFDSWKKYCIDIWDYTAVEKKKGTIYPPLLYPLPSTEFEFNSNKIKLNVNPNDNNKYVEIKYQWTKIEIQRTNLTGDDAPKPQWFLMPSVYVWCKTPSGNIIGMHVTNSMPWRNYNNGLNENL